MKMDREYGEFFPASLSPFCYNESVAQDEFPLARDAALANGLQWQESLTKTEGKETLLETPDDINDIADGILNEVLACSSCTRNYRITRQELQFYRQHQIPVPRSCFFCRLKQLYKERGPVRLWARQCMCDYKIHQNFSSHSHHKDGACPNKFETPYAPARPEIVYCEQCYTAEVV